MTELELMIVDDDEDWLERLSRIMLRKGYNIITAQGSYNAIDQLAIRLYEGIDLPDIYLCDMLERDYIIARRGIENIHPVIAYNVLNYLSSKGIKPDYFMACSANLSTEDTQIAKELNIHLVEKYYLDLDRFFIDVTDLKREDGLIRFSKNYGKYVK